MLDIHRSVVEFLSTLPVFNTWPELGTILRRSASGLPRDWHLPLIACQAAGGSSEHAIPASAALACAQISIILADDMLDDDPRGEYRRIGHGRAANYAIAFQAAGAEALLESGASLEVRHDAVTSLNEMMSVTAFGQELDVQIPADEGAYWRVVRHKSAPFYGHAFHLGALFATASPAVSRGLQRLGAIYGEMIQIHDDLNDSMAVPANADWIQQRRPLPILFALTVDHADRDRFAGIYRDITNENALQEAQDILVRCGAISYCVDHLLRRHGQAGMIFQTIPLVRRDGVTTLIDEIIAPIKNLFAALGIPEQTLPIAALQANRQE